MHFQARPHVGVVVVGHRIDIENIGGLPARRRVGASFEKEHPPARPRRKPVGEDATGRARAHDDRVKYLGHLRRGSGRTHGLRMIIGRLKHGGPDKYNCRRRGAQAKALHHLLALESVPRRTSWFVQQLSVLDAGGVRWSPRCKAGATTSASLPAMRERSPTPRRFAVNTASRWPTAIARS